MRGTKPRSNRRIRPPADAALAAVRAPRTHTPQHARSRASVRMHIPPPPTPAARRRTRHPSLVLTPSTLWSSLSVRARVVALVAGFFASYYALFAKHHAYDQRLSSIREDVRQLVSQANQSGFMTQPLVEAVIPEVFRDIDTPPPARLRASLQDNANSSVRPAPIPSTASHSDTPVATANDNLPLKENNREQTTIKHPATSHAAAEPEPHNPRNKRKRNKHKHTNPTAPPHPIIDAPSDSTSASQATSTALASRAINAVDPSHVTNAPPSHANRPNATSKQQTAQTDSSQVLGSTSTAARRQTPRNPTSAHSPLSSAAASDIAPPTANRDTRSAPAVPTTDANQLKPEEKHDYSKDFNDLTLHNVPKGHTPLLHWNYDAVMDPETTEQVFGLGNKFDHVAVYKPLCMDTTSERAISFAGRRVCGGFNRTEGWMVQYCDVMQESVRKESMLKLLDSPKDKMWLKDNEHAIAWVHGLTVLQLFQKNCANIAHFSGRLLLLQHIVENIMAYAAPPSRIQNILILPTFHVMKRFRYPHNYEFWHESLLKALVSPSQLSVGTLGNFLYRESKPRQSHAPLVQLLKNFSIEGSSAAEKKYVCFKRVVVPGYFKARFFVNDAEYPSTKPSLQHNADGAPHVPRDSLRVRERVNALFHQTPVLEPMQKEIVLLDRNGSRRVFEKASRERVVALFEKVAAEKGFTFKVTTFDKMPFREQYDAMKRVAIAIGIHGANLVNSMFMPPLSVLIELFPHGFVHEMYTNGGNAGLKYYPYMMSTGEPFKGPQPYRSVAQCVKLNENCKVHYRDAVLKVTDEDMANIENVLREAIDWCSKVPQPAEMNSRR